jgi:hypothetical protein
LALLTFVASQKISKVCPLHLYVVKQSHYRFVPRAFGELSAVCGPDNYVPYRLSLPFTLAAFSLLPSSFRHLQGRSPC